MIRGAALAAGATGLAVGAVWWWRRFRLPGGQLTVGRHFLSEPKGLLFDVDGTLTKPRNVTQQTAQSPKRTHTPQRQRYLARIMAASQLSMARQWNCSAAERCACPRRRSRRR